MIIILLLMKKCNKNFYKLISEIFFNEMREGDVYECIIKSDVNQELGLKTSCSWLASLVNLIMI